MAAKGAYVAFTRTIRGKATIASAGDVTTSPEGGIACHVAPIGLTGICVGSFEPNAPVQIVARRESHLTVVDRDRPDLRS